jgi:hypothetical protein
MESGDLVLVGILGIGFVSRTAGEMQIERIGPLADQHAFAGQADARRGRVSRSARNTPFQSAPPDMALTSCT